MNLFGALNKNSPGKGSLSRDTVTFVQRNYGVVKFFEQAMQKAGKEASFIRTEARISQETQRCGHCLCAAVKGQTSCLHAQPRMMIEGQAAVDVNKIPASIMIITDKPLEELRGVDRKTMVVRDWVFK